ncbi:MAG: BBP7 family outer membrane beta-barrel protein [Pirellulaceae bacterium]|nr:BBP7 family outer membrane beta-barrel protein [Pirellulaceae bacterium]
MRSYYARSVAAVLGLAALTGVGRAQDAGVPSLLPLPPVAPAAQYPVAQTAARSTGTSSWYNDPTQPVAPGGEEPSPSDQSIISPEYQSAMKGGYDSCGGAVPCETCCNCKYIYANGLIMGRASVPNVPTSIDTDPSTVLNTSDVQGKWGGGFEIGMGYCFNGGANALEVVYWGLFPGTQHANFYGADALGALDPSPSLEFQNLDYGDSFQTGTAFIFYEDAELHHIESSYTVNSVEVNLLGTGGCGGPFGCGAAGCGPASCGCSPWGFGWIGGFRYFNFNENFMFCTDDVDTVIDGSAGELHYDVKTTNNLFGFQLGGGINRCMGERFSLYGVGKVGIYGNDSSMRQSVYGPSGYATHNGLPGVGDYNISENKVTLATVGQIDLGMRYQMNSCWSFQMGYRVVGVTGVALTANNFAADFSDVPTIRDYDTSGSVLLHGGYAGATFAW